MSQQPVFGVASTGILSWAHTLQLATVYKDKSCRQCKATLGNRIFINIHKDGGVGSEVLELQRKEGERRGRSRD
jgi:hypothetical protein